jgi:hypothetical protein
MLRCSGSSDHALLRFLVVIISKSVFGISTAAALIATAMTCFAQSHEPATLTQQPFVCDENSCGTGSASFVSSTGHLSLQLSVAENSSVIVGSVFKNIAGTPLVNIVIDLKGTMNTTFGPYLVITYRLPAGKIAGRVIPVVHGLVSTNQTSGFTRVVFNSKNLELPDGTTIQGLELIGIGENSGGSVTVSDVTIGGAIAGKSLTTLNTCDCVP